MLYIAAEGVLGMKMRLQAYRQKFDLSDENVRFIGVPFDVRSSGDVDALLGAINDIHCTAGRTVSVPVTWGRSNGKA